jgi:hypothetical protein
LAFIAALQRSLPVKNWLNDYRLKDEWVPGRFFVIHTAYGRIGDQAVGGIEIIGYDEMTRNFRTHFFDSQGNVGTQNLTFRDSVWTWSGPTRAPEGY